MDAPEGAGPVTQGGAEYAATMLRAAADTRAGIEVMPGRVRSVMLLRSSQLRVRIRYGLGTLRLCGESPFLQA